LWQNRGPVRTPLPSLARTRGVSSAAFAAIFISALYQIPLHVRLFQPSRLGPTAVDTVIPFVDWTIWIYYSYYVLLFLPFAVSRDAARVARVLYGLMANSILAGAIFLAWPTVGVAPQPTAGGLTGLLWSALLAVDRPTNYFPSLHVANACLCALALEQESRPWRYVVVVWAALIALSTVTTKQHVVIDIPAGAALAVFSFWVVRPRVRVH